MVLMTLAHHIDVDWLREAYRRTRKDGAVGVDGQNADGYASDLEGNLRSLLDRAKSGTYRAPPVKRAYIPKGNGESMRAIGLPTFEDKVLQRAVAMVLEAVYEQEFHACSYGFRPGRSAHDALNDLQSTAVKMAGGWLLEVDISSFFDTLDHAHLRPSSGDTESEGTRRGAAAPHRQVAECGSHGRSGVVAPGRWDSARWRHLAASCEYLPAHGAG